MIEPAAQSNFRNALHGVSQQLTALFQPIEVHKVDRRLSQKFFENQTAFAPADMARRGDFFQRKRFRIVAEYVRCHHPLHLPVRVLSRARFHRQGFTAPVNHAPHPAETADHLPLIAGGTPLSATPPSPAYSRRATDNRRCRFPLAADILFPRCR